MEHQIILPDRGRTMASRAPQGTRTISNGLYRHASELGGASALLLFLSEEAAGRLTVSQAAFFLMAAAAESQGVPRTRSQLLEDDADKLAANVRNSYRQLLEPDRAFPKALGWLEAVENPEDYREKLLKLTPKGRRIVEGALEAMKPL